MNSTARPIQTETPADAGTMRRAGFKTFLRQAGNALALAGLGLGLGLATGCKSTGGSSSGAASSSPPPSRSMPTADAAALDSRLIINPTIAADLGLRCVWQQDIPLGRRARIKGVDLVSGDLVTVDSENRVTLLRLQDGYQVWHSAPMPGNERVLAFERIDMNGRSRVIAATDTDVFVLDGNTGHMITRQNMPNSPITGVSRLGPDLVYGGTDGRIVFHNARVGYELRSNRIAGQISATPVVFEDDVVAVSNLGEVVMLDGRSATKLWGRKLTGGIDARPVVTADGVFVATLGQSLWGLDRTTGDVKWKYFTESPLGTGPTALGDRIFQYVPSEGMICFEADPADSPRGKVFWRNPDINGEITTVIGNQLVLWDATTRRLRMVDADRGDVIKDVNLPKVRDLYAFRSADNDLILVATSNNGEIQRLVPRGR